MNPDGHEQDVFMLDETNEFDIAIIGMAGRFPGADTVEQYWQNLCDGVESITTFTDDELIEAGVSPALIADADYVKAAPILDNPGGFDAPFFGYSPREARTMDPQHRLFLQCAWHALEDAGYDIDSYERPIGVYGGAAMNTYFMFSGLASQFVDDYLPTLIGNDNSFLATRVSYKLNLTGPSITLQTACSTSLVAIHHACQSLLSEECDMALAGGVAVRVPHKAGHLYQDGSVFSPDGHCRSFDADAKGTIFGSGVGMIVLKRLADAIADGDQVYAVVKGSAVNNDGSSKVDYTAPSVGSQADVIAEALANAGVEARDISYVEAHGTGTQLGDPIEVAALTKAYRSDTDDVQFCALGSVKTNIGHLDAAAGIAGVIKTAMALKQKQIPATLHYQKPNPQIDFEKSPFYVNATLSEWDHADGPLLAGVSSLGIGGTNAHVILGEPPNLSNLSNDSYVAQQTVVLPLSARSPKAVSGYAASLASWLKRYPDSNLLDVANTLLNGRKQFASRFAVACRDHDSAIAALAKVSESAISSATDYVGADLVFMFPGQGSQYPQMGRDLYERETVFRNTIDHCAQILETYIDFDIRTILYPETDTPEFAEKLKNTYVAQPAIFMVEYALAQLLLSWGIRPNALIGHSVGEYAAACVAGVFSVEDALMIVANRGRLMQQLPSGSMLAVALPEAQVAKYLVDGTSVAAINDAKNCVISGPDDAIEFVVNKLDAEGISNRPLHTSHAFHSSMMDPILEDFNHIVEQANRRSPSIPIISTVERNSNGEVDFASASYWVRNLRETVRFKDAVNALSQGDPLLFVEVGPGTTLSTFVQQLSTSKAKQHIVSTMRHPKQEMDDNVKLISAIGALWQTGYSVDFTKLTNYDSAKRISLPGYAFDQTEYWANIAHANAPSQAEETNIPGALGASGKHGPYFVPSWKRGSAPIRPRLAKSTAAKTQWFVFEHTGGEFYSALVDYLNEPLQVIRVTAGDSFESLGEQQYVADLTDQSTLERLLLEAIGNDVSQVNILHCMAYEEWGNCTDYEQIQNRLTDGFFGLINLVKAISSSSLSIDIRLTIVSSNLHEVIGTETIESLKSLVLGPCRVVNKESTGILVRSIDFQKADNVQTLRAQISQIVDEVERAASDEVVAYRNGYRWLPTYEQTELPSSELSEAPINPNGTYLITGGLAGVGYEIAKFIASTYGANLVLASRTPLPCRTEWDSIRKNNLDTDEIRLRLERIQALEKLGSSVLPLTVDMTNYDQVAKSIPSIREQFGKISGVFHAAGVVHDGLIELRDKASLHQVLAPKVLGTLNLREVLEDAPPDFMVLFSSVNAVLAPAGQVAYAAANGYLDAVANSAKSSSYPITSINWPGWHETGMFGRLQASGGDLNAAISITPEEGIQALVDIMDSGLSQVIVYPHDFPAAVRGEYPQANNFTFSRNGSAKSSTTLVEDSDRKDGSVDSIVTFISQLWIELLGIEAPNPNDNFFEIGGSSLIATQMFAQLTKEYGVKLNLRTIFDAQTPHELGMIIHPLLDDSSMSSGEESHSSTSTELEKPNVTDVMNLI